MACCASSATGPAAGSAPLSPAVAPSGPVGCPASSTVASCCRCPTPWTSPWSVLEPTTARLRRGPGRAIDLTDGTELHIATIGSGPSHGEQVTAVQRAAPRWAPARRVPEDRRPWRIVPLPSELDLGALIAGRAASWSDTRHPRRPADGVPGRGRRRGDPHLGGPHGAGLPPPRRRAAAVRPLQRAGGARQAAHRARPPARRRRQPPLAAAVPVGRSRGVHLLSHADDGQVRRPSTCPPRPRRDRRRCRVARGQRPRARSRRVLKPR